MAMQPHIRCSDKDRADYALLPGDPARLDKFADHLTGVAEIACNREHRSLSGTYKGVRVLVVSTGMGGPSTGIAVEELSNIGVKAVIRVGSCGATQPGIATGDLLIPSGAVRDDGTSKAYIDNIYPAVPDTALLCCLVESAAALDAPHHVGIVRSHDSFYTDREEEIGRYWSARQVLGADMETAALLTIGRLRRLRAASVLNTVTEWEGDLQGDINHYVEEEDAASLGERRSILTALEACVRLEQGGGPGRMRPPSI